MSRAKTRRPGTRAGTQGGRRAESIASTEPYDRVEVVTDAAPAATRRARPRTGAASTAADAALADLIAATTADVEAAVEVVGDSQPPPLPLPEVDVDPGPRSVTSSLLDDSQLVAETVLPEIPTLRFVVLEEAAHLATAQATIVAAGHAVAATGGRDRVDHLVELVRDSGADAALVALPGGEPIIEAALALAPRRPVTIAAVGGAALEASRRAIAAGADLVAPRPHTIDRLAPILLAAARLARERDASLDHRPRGTAPSSRAGTGARADTEPGGLESLDSFQRVLDRELERARRFEYPLSVALFAVELPSPPPPAGVRGILRARAGNALVHAIRDIDVATQLDHERFLVLLPYTDLQHAALVARRVIAAVGAGEPVTAGGRTFPPRLVGAVAGGRIEGDTLGFAKLMRDATRALDQARRDGAELAVQP